MQIERSEEQRHDKNHENLTMTDQMQLYDAKNGIARSITQQDTCHNPANPPIISSTQLAELNAGLLNHYLEYSLATRAKIKKKLQGMISGDTPYLYCIQNHTNLALFYHYFTID